MPPSFAPPRFMSPPARRNPEKARRAWRIFGPLAIGMFTFPFFWVPTLAIPSDPAHPIQNLVEITSALRGDEGWVRSLKVASDIRRSPRGYAEVVVAASKWEAAGVN